MDPTPPQTIGPFFHFSLTPGDALGQLAGPEAKGERIRIVCRLLDADGEPVTDGMLEISQADAEGRRARAGDAFRGFGRLATNENGLCVFETVKPGRVAGPGGELQAPHIDVSVFARGLLMRAATRIYFAGDPANVHDAVLESIPADRRDTVIARPDPVRAATWSFAIRLSGAGETVFFDV